MVSRAAVITEGVVVNITIADADFAAEQGWVISEEAETGDLWDGEVFTKPPAPELPPPAVPQVVSMRQARHVLFAVGLLESVEAVIAGITDPTVRVPAQIDWEYATEVRRQSPLINSLGPALGLTEGQIDGLFSAAAAIS